MKIIVSKRLLSWVLCLSVLPLWADESSNLVKNPSFEQIKASTGLPEFWETMIRQGKDKKIGCQFSIVKDAQDGNAAANITVADQGKVMALAEFYQLVPVKPKTKYYFALYLRTAAYNNAWPCAYVEERTRDKGFPHYVSPSNHLAKNAESAKPDQYVLQDVTFTTGEETFWVNISLRLQNLGCGTVQFDNVMLLEQPDHQN